MTLMQDLCDAYGLDADIEKRARDEIAAKHGKNWYLEFIELGDELSAINRWIKSGRLHEEKFHFRAVCDQCQCSFSFYGTERKRHGIRFGECQGWLEIVSKETEEEFRGRLNSEWENRKAAAEIEKAETLARRHARMIFSEVSLRTLDLRPCRWCSRSFEPGVRRYHDGEGDSFEYEASAFCSLGCEAADDHHADTCDLSAYSTRCRKCGDHCCCYDA